MAQPDLNSIIELIMKNPELIEQIQALAKNNESEPKEAAQTVPAVAEKPEETEEVSIPHIHEEKSSRAKRRNELLRAITPYISENRRRAVESFMSIAEILDVVR